MDGVGKWVDGPKFRRGLPDDQDWRATLVDTLRETDAVIVLLSDRAARSPQVSYELGVAEALGEGRQVVPVMLPDLDPARLPKMGERNLLDARRAANPGEVAALVLGALNGLTAGAAT